MKKFNLYLFGGCFALLSILTSCGTNKNCELSEESKRAIAQEIEIIMDRFFNAESMSYSSHVGLRANKEGYLMAGDGGIKYTDYQTYNNAMKESFQNIQRFTEMKRLQTVTYVLANDAATCTTVFESKFLTKSGDTIVNNGCWTFIFKKFDEGWKVIHENGTHTK